MKNLKNGEVGARIEFSDARGVFWTMLFLILFQLQCFAQTKTVSGKVTSEDGELLPGVSIVVKGTSNGTVTNIDGAYHLEVETGNTLVFSFIGMETQEWNVDERTTINVVMASATEAIDEVVVTGYGGKQKRSKLTNSIAKVSEETLEVGMHANPAQALSGAVSGLVVQQTSGNPRSEPNLILRGGTNLNGTGSPLVIVDGQVRSMSDINPNDIESVEVMKDAGATAIYGARANNGVILITTKKGKQGISKIEFSTKVGLNYYNNGVYDFLSAEDYLTNIRKAYWRASRVYQTKDGNWTGPMTNIKNLSAALPYGTGNRFFDDNGNILNGNENASAVWSPMTYTSDLAFLLDRGWKKMTDPLAAYSSEYDQEIIFKEFRLSDVNLRDPSVSQDYNINFSGGNDKGQYYAGLGYNYSNGTAVGNWYKRISFLFNGDYKIREWLTSYSSINFADVKWRDLSPTRTDESQYFSRVLSLPPTFRGINEDGEWLIGTRGAGDGNQQINSDKFIRDFNNDKFTLSQSFELALMKGLSFKLTGTWHFDQDKLESFNKDYLTNVGPTYNSTRVSWAEFSENRTQTYNGILNYDLELKDTHTLSAMLGFEYFDAYYKMFYAEGNGAPTDDFMDLGLTSTAEGARVIDSSHSRQRIMSYFGRVNYDYLGKYLVSAVLRYDGYSKLASENRWGTFPGVSAGWVMSKEDFMEQLSDVISFAKLRSSYGLNGNVSGIGNYYVQGAYTRTLYGGQTGFTMSTLPNPGLLWERSRTAEFGIDLGFVKNRYNLSLTYYDRLTKDKFADITLPSHSGISSYRSNNGEVQNRGLEIETDARIIAKKDWKWNVNIAAAYNVNKIISLPDNGLERNRQGAVQVYDVDGNLMWVGGLQEGQRPGDIYAFKALGIYKDESEIPAYLIDQSTGTNGSNNRKLYGPSSWAEVYEAGTQGTGLPIQPGDVKFLDVNNDGIIDDFDMVKIGNTTPKWTGGVNTNLTWKNLSLKVRTDFALGHVIQDTKFPWIMGAMQGQYNTIEMVKDTWSETNPNGKYPVYVWADQLGKRNYARPSSMFIYKADYLAFREVSLSYSIPKNIIQKLKMGGLKLSVTGQNLGYWTAAKNLYSPEYGASGEYGYSLPRTVIFGANFTF
ncbi:MAG: SusC/RagA family TonB-linked outer membrane protein [Draconibacterium sp.]